MNFFEHQARAQRHSVLLIVLFLLAVSILVWAVTMVVAYTYLYGGGSIGLSSAHSIDDLGSGFYLLVASGTLIVIIGATLWKLSQLSAGGHVVAEMLGGERIDPGSGDPAKRRLINVVEEMAIASGTRVPAIYLIESQGINAFAAGFSPNQAVIGITRGCLELLSRDELQGVVAHEFSHILNGDMRLNMRLMGVLHGILVIGLLGQALMRGTFKRSRYRYRYLDSDPARRRGSSGTTQTFLAGLALMTVGYLGVLLGNLIKAALSRQREFLADASAVQFTRNADGIVNALRKIRLNSSAARISAPNSEQASHLFFGEAVRSGFTNLLSTHPPLDVRINRINPRFSIERDPLPGVGVEYLENAGPIPRFSELPMEEGSEAFTAQESTPPVTANQLVESMGNPATENLQQAQQTHAAIPDFLLVKAHSADGARALLLAMLFEAGGSGHKASWAILNSYPQLSAVRECQRLLSDLPAQLRLPLIDISLPAVSMLDSRARLEHLKLMRSLLKAGDAVSFSQYVVFAIARAQLVDESSSLKKVRYHRLQTVMADVALVCGLMARIGHADPALATRAYAEAMAKVGARSTRLPESGTATVAALEKSLGRLSALALMPKMKVIRALASAVLHDEQVQTEELELLRAICEILECPMPPLAVAQS